ncbi:MAG TPA: rhodanese-like domain-containing protein [Pseudomonas sp.]|nr:rhodanese-like domain-containing protein [Pseudomonas sp.]
MRRLSAIFLLFSLGAQAAGINQTVALQTLNDPNALLIDVRTLDEFAEGALPGAQRIGHEQIAEQIGGLTLDKDRPIVLYCRSGRRSDIAQDRLIQLGYRQVINAGGYDDLKAALAQH